MNKLELLGHQAPLVINPFIQAEISFRFERAAEVDAALQLLLITRKASLWDAAYLAGQAFKILRLA